MSIANPIDAIGNATTRSKLAEVLDELLKQWYPDSSKEGWEAWSVKYKDLDTTKRAAVHMYRRLLGR